MQEKGYFVIGCDINLFEGCEWESYPKPDLELIKDLRDVTVKDLANVDCIMHLGALSNDPMGDIATTINGGLDGFYPFIGIGTNFYPWNWVASGTTSPFLNCNTNATTAKLYIDTIIQYFAPRACQALDLGCNYTSRINEFSAEQVNLSIAPAPATNVIYFNTKDANMLDINIFDMNGRLVRTNNGINATTYEMQRAYLKAGFYIAEIRFEQGTVRKKLVIMD